MQHDRAMRPVCAYKWMKWSLGEELQASRAELFSSTSAVPEGRRTKTLGGSDFCRTNADGRERAMSTGHKEAVRFLEGLQGALEGTEADFASMPFFVRPMVRGGFARRTGMGIEEWRRLAELLIAEVRSGADPAHVRERHPVLRTQLARLAESYRTAPERAARGMGGKREALQSVTDTARQREAAVRALLGWLE